MIRMHVSDSNQRVEFLGSTYLSWIRYRERVTTITASPPTPVRVESLADVQVRLALPILTKTADLIWNTTAAALEAMLTRQ